MHWGGGGGGGGGGGEGGEDHLIKGLCYHGDLVALVGGLCKALEGGGLHHGLTEGHHRVGHLHLNLSVQLTKILQASIWYTHRRTYYLNNANSSVSSSSCTAWEHTISATVTVECIPEQTLVTSVVSYIKNRGWYPF